MRTTSPAWFAGSPMRSSRATGVLTGSCCSGSAPVARRSRVASPHAIATIEGVEVPVGELDVTLYRDDLALRDPMPIGPPRSPSTSRAGPSCSSTTCSTPDARSVPRSTRSARSVARPASASSASSTAGHRELPIRADHVGKNIPTSAEEQVIVRLVETDGVDEVVIGGAR
jgi:pyrimidine operon attenuation protein / uracil phosphoribosyltransferase